MGTITLLYAEPCRDKQGRVVFEVGQKWINRGTLEVCLISDIECVTVDDEEKISIYITDLDGIEYESYYTETYFRRYFRELYSFQKRKNQMVTKESSVRNMKHWKRTGALVPRVKR